MLDFALSLSLPRVVENQRSYTNLAPIYAQPSYPLFILSTHQEGCVCTPFPYSWLMPDLATLLSLPRLVENQVIVTHSCAIMWISFRNIQGQQWNPWMLVKRRLFWKFGIFKKTYRHWLMHENMCKLCGDELNKRSFLRIFL